MVSGKSDVPHTEGQAVRGAVDRKQSGIHGLVLRLGVSKFDLRAALRARAGRHILMGAGTIGD